MGSVIAGTWALLLCGMWDLSGPGIKPEFPVLSSRLSITGPPGDPLYYRFCKVFIKVFMAKVINVGTQIYAHQSQHNMQILIS